LDKEILRVLLPELLLSRFELKEIVDLGDVLTRKMFYEIHLEEYNVIPPGYEASGYESKGFTEVRIQDFPLRGKAVYLIIRRRRWRNKTNPQEVIRSDYSYIAEGSKLTKELSDFLKGTGRYKGGYD
jgi:hypothetical protein